MAGHQRTARADGTAGQVFDAIRAAYADLGHGGHWYARHQGGATGHAGREWFASPDTDASVVAPNAYAWNPTIRGTKSEDTLVAAEDGPEWLTRTGDWPTIDADPTASGDPVERPAVLTR